MAGGAGLSLRSKPAEAEGEAGTAREKKPRLGREFGRRRGGGIGFAERGKRRLDTLPGPAVGGRNQVLRPPGTAAGRHIIAETVEIGLSGAMERLAILTGGAVDHVGDHLRLDPGRRGRRVRGPRAGGIGGGKYRLGGGDGLRAVSLVEGEFARPGHQGTEGGNTAGDENRLEIDIHFGDRMYEHFRRRHVLAGPESADTGQIVRADHVERDEKRHRIMRRAFGIDAGLATFTALAPFTAGLREHRLAGRYEHRLLCLIGESEAGWRKQHGGAEACPETAAAPLCHDPYPIKVRVMFICIKDVLDAQALSSLSDALEQLDFAPGAATAGWHARGVKVNRQAVPSAALRLAQARLVKVLEDHAVIRARALPARIAAPLFGRYGPGEHYGPHVDDALIGTPPIRSDLSVTVFLTPPEDYAGGELILASTAGEEAIKLGAGAAVLYPSGCLHRVAPVTEGERRVAVTWIQSLVRDAAARDILYDLAMAKQAVFDAGGKSPAFDLLAKSHANLLRRWAEVQVTAAPPRPWQ